MSLRLRAWLGRNGGRKAGDRIFYEGGRSVNGGGVHGWSGEYMPGLVEYGRKDRLGMMETK